MNTHENRVCAYSGCNRQASPTGNKRKRDGLKTRQKYCGHHKKVIYNVIGFEYVKYKKDICECCGFIPEDPCQLTIDHYDGDHYNNDPSNLITSCHNCHALKTFKQKDNLNRYV